MNVDTRNLLRGITAREANIDKGTWSRAMSGKEALSAKSARKAATAAGESPAGVYAASQAHSIAKRRDDGELDNGQVLGAVGRAFSALKEEFGQDQVDLENDRLFTNAVEVLQGLAEVATKGATPKSTYEALGRDASGLATKKRQEAVATKGKSVPGIMGRLGRNVDGTSRKA